MLLSREIVNVSIKLCVFFFILFFDGTADTSEFQLREVVAVDSEKKNSHYFSHFSAVSASFVGMN